MPEVEQIILKESETLCDYEPLGSFVLFDYTDYLDRARKEVKEKLDKQAPPNATHYRISTSFGEPILCQGEKCDIQYFRKKVL